MEESGVQDELGHGGVPKSISPSKPAWALGTVTEARTAKQMEEICCSQDQKPCSSGEQTVPLCVSSSPPSQSGLHRLRREYSGNNRTREAGWLLGIAECQSHDEKG